MKIIRLTSIFLFIALTVMARTDVGVWQPTGGVEGGVVSQIVRASANVMIAGNYEGALFRSTDNGSQWTSISQAIGHFSVFSLAGDGAGTVFVGTKRSIYKTTDAGKTWRLSAQGLPFLTDVNDITLEGSGRVWIAYARQGIFRSLDNGENWSAANGGLPEDRSIQQIQHVQGDVLIAADSKYGIFRSTDGGENWAPANDGFSVGSSAQSIITGADGIVWIATYGEGIFRSADQGATWQKTTGTPADPYVFSLAVNSSGHLFAVTNSDLYRSVNGGADWSKMTTGAVGGNLRCINCEPDDTIWIGTAASGIGRSIDGGNSWSFFTSGLTATHVPSLTRDAHGTLYAAVLQMGLFKSSDDGRSWTKVPVDDQVFDDGILQVKSIPSGGLMVSSFPKGVFVSRDYSQWDAFGAGPETINLVKLAASDLYFYAGAQNGKLFRSPSTAGEWGEIGTTINASYLYSLDARGNEVYICTNKGVFHSKDHGETWQSVNIDGSTSEYYFSVVFHPNGDVFIGGNRGVYRSSDGGVTWSAGSGLPSGNVLAVHSDGTLFAASYQSAYFSRDLGSNWQQVAAGAENIEINSLVVGNNDLLFAGTRGLGVYRVELPQPTAVVGEVAVSECSLAPNFPNPFNSSTTFSFSLTEPTFVRLTLFNLRGEQQATVAAQLLDAGQHSITWDAGVLPSGVYLYRLEAGEFVQSRKLIYMR